MSSIFEISVYDSFVTCTIQLILKQFELIRCYLFQPLKFYYFFFLLQKYPTNLLCRLIGLGAIVENYVFVFPRRSAKRFLSFMPALRGMIHFVVRPLIHALAIISDTMTRKRG